MYGVFIGLEIILTLGA